MGTNRPGSREDRRTRRARVFWSVLGVAFVVAALVALIVGRPGLGLAFLVGVAICLAAMTGAGRAATRDSR